MTLQVAEVTKVLGSVNNLVEAGNKVVLGSQGSYIINKRTERVTPIERRNGAFHFDIWVKKNGDEGNARKGTSASPRLDAIKA